MSHQTNTRVEGEDLAVPPNPRKLHIALKRAMDVTIGLALFVFALPLMLLIAGLIVARDGAPAPEHNHASSDFERKVSAKS